MVNVCIACQCTKIRVPVGKQEEKNHLKVYVNRYPNPIPSISLEGWRMIAEVMIFNELGANSEIGKEFRVENRSSVSAVLNYQMQKLRLCKIGIPYLQHQNNWIIDSECPIPFLATYLNHWDIILFVMYVRTLWITFSPKKWGLLNQCVIFRRPSSLFYFYLMSDVRSLIQRLSF